MATIEQIGDSGFPTGKVFETTAPHGKVRAVIFNQDTGARFFRDYEALAEVQSFSDFVSVMIYDEHGKRIKESGESWNE